MIFINKIRYHIQRFYNYFIFKIRNNSFIKFLKKKQQYKYYNYLYYRFYSNNPQCMSSTYHCVNCNISFYTEEPYKLHYKSEHHRYNIKRKLIGLLGLSLQQYQLQFERDLTQKSSTQKELHCEICSKKFMSANTYKQHLNSQKHKLNRKKLTNQIPKDTLSKSSSQSEFSVLGLEKPNKCIFCDHIQTSHHYETHNFPPFKQECIDVEQLSHFVSQIIKNGECIYCGAHFNSQDSVKQHMMDLGHDRLNIDHFQRFEKYYLWKITEVSSQEECKGQDYDEYLQEESFEDLKNPTLVQIERRRQRRIKYGIAGVTINGKQVGYRDFRKYYKQYLGRYCAESKLREQKCLTNSEADNILPLGKFFRLNKPIRNTIRTTSKAMNTR